MNVQAIGSMANGVDVGDIVARVRAVVGTRAGPIALHEPEFRGREWQYVKDCIDTGWVSSVGKYVDRFESMLCEQTGSKFAVATVNGTAALHVCLILADVRRGDEVLIPSLTFIATANAVSYAGATPHLVDSEERTLGVAPEKLARHLREIAEVRDGRCINRGTGAVIRALMPMHTFGHAVDIEALQAICSEWCITLIEDAAESLGSVYLGRHLGTFGRVSGLSFNGNKVVTTGGGGAILTSDPELGRRAKHLTTTARLPHRWSFIHDEIGFNYRMPNINAALGCAQLEMLSDFIARKRDLASRYRDAFAGAKGATVVVEPEGCSSNYWLNAILLEPAASAQRDALLAALNDDGVIARPVWTLMHELPMYANCPRADLSCAESIERRLINLPSSPALAGKIDA